jgi:hypothetical protein
MTAVGLALAIAGALLLAVPALAARALGLLAWCAAALALGERYGAAPGIAAAIAMGTAAAALRVLAVPRPPRIPRPPRAPRAPLSIARAAATAPRAARAPWRALDRAARVTTALAGTLPPALLLGGTLAAHLPLAPGVRFAIGAFAIVPLWVAAMPLVLLVRRGWAALLACAIATAVLARIAPEAAFWPSLP